jgi:hypothetical protein
VFLAGLTKPGEVGEILALYRLKSLSLDYKAKLMTRHNQYNPPSSAVKKIPAELSVTLKKCRAKI